MYFPDLSQYTYLGLDPSVLNVGWLDAQHPFQRGKAPSQFVDRLRTLVHNSVHQTRGFHQCSFCTDPTARGSAEILVTGETGARYAAPTLILHYVEAHKYLPPAEFIAAVVGGDGHDRQW